MIKYEHTGNVVSVIELKKINFHLKHSIMNKEDTPLIEYENYSICLRGERSKYHNSWANRMYFDYNKFQWISEQEQCLAQCIRPVGPAFLFLEFMVLF